MWHESAKGRGASQDRTTSNIMRSNTMASFWADEFTARRENKKKKRGERDEKKTKGRKVEK